MTPGDDTTLGTLFTSLYQFHQHKTVSQRLITEDVCGLPFVKLGSPPVQDTKQ